MHTHAHTHTCNLVPRAYNNYNNNNNKYFIYSWLYIAVYNNISYTK